VTTDTAQSLASAKEAKRDTRLDFFRGIGMFIIVIAHMPGNTWVRWIPARWGYSDATEIFVFCSGAASAIAFYKLFQDKGWMVGTIRVAYRIWQLYWCHIGIFFTILTTLMLIDLYLPDANQSYVTALNLRRFVNNVEEFLPALFTLTYVPNLFDILVMYIVVLGLMPIVIWLSWQTPEGQRPWLAMAFCVGLWAIVSQPWLAFLDLPIFTGLNMRSEPLTRDYRAWFFNPFCWQLIFFTGFAFSLGWLPKPPVKWWLIVLCLLILIPCFFLDPDGRPARRLIRYIHFLALAYIVWVAAGDRGRRLPSTGILGGLVTVIRRVGQQSLAVFIGGLLVSRILGVILKEADPDFRGPELPPLDLTIAINLLSFALVIAIAYVARYFRNPPWKT